MRYFLMFLTGVVTSFYFFPFFFKVFPLYNTKTLMAAVGLVWLFLKVCKRNESLINKDWFTLSLWAGVMSLIGLLAVTINETPDYAYATYIVSMWVWWSAAYVVYSIMKGVHGNVSVTLVCNYLIVVCVVQCVLALLIDNYPSFRNIVDTYIEQDQEFLKGVKRWYGIGASLDVAGSRFAAVLIMIAFILTQWKKKLDWRLLTCYIVAFVFIGVVGNIIARTTTVGLVLAVAFLLWKGGVSNKQMSREKQRLWISIGVVVLIAIPVLIYLYNNVPAAHKQLRFAFEGFFNWIEKGEWATSSTDRLVNVMYVFPDNLKSWIIGDGYFTNPREIDPYFVGKIIGGYYMGTDVGYLRFIFYFGVIGMLAFFTFMCKAGQICMHRFNNQKILFLMLLAVNFIVWFKVATDIFLVFALFLCISKEENDDCEQRTALQQ